VVFDTTDSAFSPPTDHSGRPAIVSNLGLLLLTIAALSCAGILARWNIRQGRWDRSNALRAAGAVFVGGFVAGVLRADHVPIANDQYLMLARMAGWYLYSAGFIFLMYVAFEPFVRQHWPRVLTSWNRLLSGRVGDALVGRDMLIGVLAGVALALLREAEFIVSPWLGLTPSAPYTSTLDGLGSWRQFAGLGVFLPFEALALTFGWLLILLLFRIALRVNALAIIAAIVIVLPTVTLPGDHLLLEVAVGLLLSALSVFVLLRFGLLALVVEITVANAFSRLPMTFNSSDWYMGRSVVVLLCLAGLAAYSLRVSLRGRPPLRRTPVAV